MTKNPFINAFAALVYIVLVASFMFYSPKFEAEVQTVFVPVAMISLFVLSAAVMGYLFVYQPIRLYLDGEKKAGANLFLTTLGTFAAITVLVFATVFWGMR
jgi:hypothetical protein